MFRRPRDWERKRQIVLMWSGGVCAICHELGADSVDHIVPRAKVIDHSFANLQAVHKRCNSSKGDRQLLPLAMISERWRK